MSKFLLMALLSLFVFDSFSQDSISKPVVMTSFDNYRRIHGGIHGNVTLSFALIAVSINEEEDVYYEIISYRYTNCFQGRIVKKENQGHFMSSFIKSNIQHGGNFTKFDNIVIINKDGKEETIDGFQYQYPNCTAEENLKFQKQSDSIFRCDCDCYIEEKRQDNFVEYIEVCADDTISYISEKTDSLNLKTTVEIKFEKGDTISHFETIEGEHYTYSFTDHLQKVQYEGQFSSNDTLGVFKEYRNGCLVIEGKFKEQLLVKDTFWRAGYDSTILVTHPTLAGEGEFHKVFKGVRHGKWSYCDVQGKLIRKEKYKMGKMIKEEEYE